jgi:cytochrome P450
VAGESENKSETGQTVTSDEGVDLLKTAQELFKYFGAITEDRRANPRDGVSTVIANGQIDGQPIGDREAMSYYIIVATAGHDTTSSTVSGGMLELIRRPDQLAKLKNDLSLLPNAIEEMIRWTTPVKHFMRTATEDYTLRGKTIRKATGSPSSTGQAIATRRSSRIRSNSGSTGT